MFCHTKWELKSELNYVDGWEYPTGKRFFGLSISRRRRWEFTPTQKRAIKPEPESKSIPISQSSSNFKLHGSDPGMSIISYGKWNGQYVAVKQPKFPEKRDSNYYALINEQLLLGPNCPLENRHTGIIKVFAISQNPLKLIMELATRGDLYAARCERESNVLNWDDRLRILIEIAEALAACHLLGIIHCGMVVWFGAAFSACPHTNIVMWCIGNARARARQISNHKILCCTAIRIPSRLLISGLRVLWTKIYPFSTKNKSLKGRARLSVLVPRLVVAAVVEVGLIVMTIYVDVLRHHKK